MGSCNWLLIFYSTKCLGRLLHGLRSPQVVARGVRRAQRCEARLGDVDGGRRLRAGDARGKAAEAREERRLVAPPHTQNEQKLTKVSKKGRPRTLPVGVLSRSPLVSYITSLVFLPGPSAWGVLRCLGFSYGLTAPCHLGCA